MATVLETLPAESTGVAFVELDSEDDRLELTTPPGIALTWLFRGEQPRGSLLTEAVKQVTDAGPGWYA
jgi:NADPH-dependent ferric siderophore reductase